jgi:hypothetical protein
VGLKDKMRRRERAAEKHTPDTLRLEDGEEVRLRPGDRLQALLAVTEGDEHPLHEPLRRLAPGADPGARELAELVDALSSSAGAPGGRRS